MFREPLQLLEGKRLEGAVKFAGETYRTRLATAERQLGGKAKFLPWVGRMVKKGGSIEKALQVVNRLDKRIIQRLEKKDITGYKTIEDLEDALSNVFIGGLIRRGRKDTEIILETPDHIVIYPKTKAASQYWGNKTNWCVSRRGKNNLYCRYGGEENKFGFFILRKRGYKKDGFNKVALFLFSDGGFSELTDEKQSKSFGEGALGRLITPTSAKMVLKKARSYIKRQGGLTAIGTAKVQQDKAAKIIAADYIKEALKTTDFDKWVEYFIVGDTHPIRKTRIKSSETADGVVVWNIDTKGGVKTVPGVGNVSMSAVLDVAVMELKLGARANKKMRARMIKELQTTSDPKIWLRLMRWAYSLFQSSWGLEAAIGNGMTLAAFKNPNWINAKNDWIQNRETNSKKSWLSILRTPPDLMIVRGLNLITPEEVNKALEVRMG